MRRPKAHEIDELAQRVFQDAMPPGWVHRKQHPDYGVDYLVEIFKNEKPTGIQFAVQLKGTQSLRLRKGVVRFPLETSHLVYYLDKVSPPVFLIVVDVAARCGYWLFTQAYALDKLHGRDWRRQKTVTLQLAAENNLADTDRLQTAVRRAVARMAELHPASIPGVITAERKRMESLDPRFEIKVEATEDGTQYHLLAKEPVEGRFTLKGPPNEVQQKFEDLVFRGMPVTVRPDEFKMTGTPLLQEFAEHGGMIHWSRKVQVALSLTALDADGSALGRIEHIPGELKGGLSEFQCECKLAGSPLVIRFPYKPSPEQRGGRIDMSFHLQPWHGQPLLQLAYFDQLHSVFGCIDCVEQMKVVGSERGNRLFSGSFLREGLNHLKHLSPLLECIRKARELARHFGVNPQLPSDFGLQHVSEIEEAYGLFRDGEYRKPAAGLRVNLDVPIPGIQNLLAGPDADLKLGTLTLHREAEPFPFLGTGVDLGPIDFELTEARCELSREDLKRLVETSTSDMAELSFVGTAGSELILRRVTDR